jgi:hypothetical protein
LNESSSIFPKGRMTGWFEVRESSTVTCDGIQIAGSTYSSRTNHRTLRPRYHSWKETWHPTRTQWLVLLWFACHTCNSI